MLEAGTVIHRIYDPDHYDATATGFRVDGPYARFDHHIRASRSRRKSRSRRILYGGVDFKCCLVEVFGDSLFGFVKNTRHCEIRTSREIKLLHLFDDGALRAGTVTAVCSGPHLVARAWSRYFYEHPDLYGKIDGLAYRNAHNEGVAYALYDRAENACKDLLSDNRLDDESRRLEYETIASTTNLPIVFYKL